MRLSPVAWTLFFALVLCLPPQAMAQTSITQATFKATSASWVSDNSSAKGEFVGLYNRLQTSALESRTPADSFFELHAQQAHIEVDIADYYFVSPVAGGALPPFTERTQLSSVRTETTDVTNAFIYGSESEADRFLYVFPYGEGVVRMEANCASAKATLQDPSLPLQPDPTVIRAESYVDSRRPDPQADISNTLNIMPCDGTQLTVSGTFLVVLWAWDGQVQSKEESFELRSGYETPIGPLNGDNGVFMGTAQEAYIYVQKGRFTIVGDDVRPTWVYFDQVSLQGVTQLSLQDVQGQIQDLPPIHGDHVRLMGDLDIGLVPDSDLLLKANVGGSLQALDVDGHRMEFATVLPAVPVAGSDPNLLIAAILAFALSAWLLGVRIRQDRRSRRKKVESGVGRHARRASFHALEARRSLGESRMPRALRHATRAVRLAPDVPSHRVLRCVVLQECARQTGRQVFLREAEREEAKLNRDLADPQERAGTRAEATELLCALGRREEALLALQQAAADDVSVVVRRLLDGGYRLLWDEPWVQALRNAAQPAAYLDPAFS